MAAPGGLDGRIGSESAALARRATTAAEQAENKAWVVINRRPKLGRIAKEARDVLRRQSNEQVSLAASGAAFWLVISAFPIGAAVVSLFGLLVSPTQVANDLGSLTRAAPSSLGSLISQQLHRVAVADPTGLTIGFALSVITAIWSASAGVYNLERAVRYSFGLPRGSYVKARVRALLSAAMLVVALGALALAASVIGGHAPADVVAAVGLPLAVVVLTAGITTMYRLSIGPTVPLRRLLPGATAAAVAAVISLTAFAVYLAVSTPFAAVYGAFAGLMVGMFGMYLAVYAVLLGAVLDARLIGAAAKSSAGGTPDVLAGASTSSA